MQQTLQRCEPIRSAEDVGSYSVPRIDANRIEISECQGVSIPSSWHRQISRLRHSDSRWKLKNQLIRACSWRESPKLARRRPRVKQEM